MKNYGLTLLAAAIIFLFTACGSGNPAKIPATQNPNSVLPPEKDAVEITVITSYGGDDGNRQNYEKAISAYEAASGNIVKDASSVSNEEWKSRILSDFENQTEPDVLFYFTGADSNSFVESGKVVSIDEIREIYPDYASNMKDELLAKSPVDGKNYAVPVNGYWEGLFVNKKVLADCGVKIPGPDTTWEQFVSDCAKIAAKGYIPIAASLNEVPHYWFEFCVFNNGNTELHTILPENSGDDAGKVWTAGLNDIKSLYDLGFFPEDTLTASSSETDVLMISDRAAFMLEGSWKIGWIAENAADSNNFTVTYVPGKGQRKATDIIGGLSMGYYITRKAWDNPDKRSACVDFVKAMTTDEVVAAFGPTAVTALKNGITPPSEAGSLIKDALEMTKNITGIVPATADALPSNSRSALFADVKNIVTGNITAEQAIDNSVNSD